MKSFHLSLGRLDRKLILRLAAGAYRLRLRRLSIWLNMKVRPWGTLIATFQTMELGLHQLMENVVVKNDA